MTVGFQDDDFPHFYNLATLGPFRFVLLRHGNHPHALRNLLVAGVPAASAYTLAARRAPRWLRGDRTRGSVR